jgi:hypothetical protein
MRRVDLPASAPHIPAALGAAASGGEENSLEIISVRSACAARVPIDDDIDDQASLLGGDGESRASGATPAGSWWETLRSASQVFAPTPIAQAKYAALPGIDTEAHSSKKPDTLADEILMLAAHGAYKKRNGTGSELGILLDASGEQREHIARKVASDQIHKLLGHLRQDLEKKTGVCPFSLIVGSQEREDATPIAGDSFETRSVWHGMHWSRAALGTSSLRATALALQRLRPLYQPGSGPDEGGIADILTYLLLDLPGLEARVDIDQKRLLEEFKASFGRGRDLCRPVGNRPA